MLTRSTFSDRFGPRAVIGMIHLNPLPGSPLYGGSMAAVVDGAMDDLHAIVSGGADAVMIENFGDRPFVKDHVAAETIASMAAVVAMLRAASALPAGVNVLRNDAAAALAIAAATGASFIRVNVHTGVMLTDQGMIEGRAAETLRDRARLAPDVAIFADHLVKHAVPLGPVDHAQSAKDLRLRGLADALIVTGKETGGQADEAMLGELREAMQDVPLLIGSGLTAGNAGNYAAADGVIVGTAIKRGADVGQPVVRAEVERIVAAFKGAGGR